MIVTRRTFLLASTNISLATLLAGWRTGGLQIDDVLLFGDSNCYSGLSHNGGQGYNPAIDVTDPRCIAFYVQNGNHIDLCRDPLEPGVPAGAIGPGLTFLRDQYVPNLLAPGHIVRLTVFGIGGSGFSNGNWVAPNGASLTFLATRYNVAVRASTDPTGGTLSLMLMCMGTNDAIARMARTTFTTNTVAMVSWLRANLAGGTSVPFLCAGLVGAWTKANPAIAGPIHGALQSLPSHISKCGFVDTSDTIGQVAPGSAYHFCDTDQRTIGKRFYTQAYLNMSS